MVLSPGLRKTLTAYAQLSTEARMRLWPVGNGRNFSDRILALGREMPATEPGKAANTGQTVADQVDSAAQGLAVVDPYTFAPPEIA